METIVNLKIVLKLKEVGFDLMPYLKVDNKNPKNLQSNCNPKEYQPWYFKLTVFDVVMWLYEKHGIWIEAYRSIDHCADVNDPYIFVTKYTGRKEFKTPIDAYMSAIEYVLENKISQ